MADTTFTSGSTIASAWLNDVNAQTYSRVTNITALKALDKNRFTRAETLGYYSSGDGGHGMYYYDSTDTTSADNGGTIIVGTDGGRWKLVYLDTIFVNQFGAKGDWNGTTGTDDSSKFQAAFNALPTVGGKVGARPGKQYLLSSPVTLSGAGHIDFFGGGAAEASNNVGATEIIKASTVTSAIFVVSSPFASIRNMVIRGATGNTGDGVQISANSVRLDGVSVFKMGNDGVRIGTDAGTNANSWSATHCRFNDNTRFGLYVSDNVSPSLPNANAGTWLNCVAQGNGNDGLRIGNATLNSFLGGTVESNGGCGVRINGTGANYNTIVGMDFDSGNSAGKLRIETGAVYNRIESATLYDTDIVDNGTKTFISVPNSSNAGNYVSGMFQMDFARGGGNYIRANASGGYLAFYANADTTTDANAHLIVSSAGLYAGRSGGKVGFYGTTPISQPTTASAAATFVANSGTAINDASTFDGYTLKQIVKALRNSGLLA